MCAHGYVCVRAHGCVFKLADMHVFMEWWTRLYVLCTMMRNDVCSKPRSPVSVVSVKYKIQNGFFYLVINIWISGGGSQLIKSILALCYDNEILEVINLEWEKDCFDSILRFQHHQMSWLIWDSGGDSTWTVMEEHMAVKHLFTSWARRQREKGRVTRSRLRAVLVSFLLRWKGTMTKGTYKRKTLAWGLIVI